MDLNTLSLGGADERGRHLPHWLPYAEPEAARAGPACSPASQAEKARESHQATAKTPQELASINYSKWDNLDTDSD